MNFYLRLPVDFYGGESCPPCERALNDSGLPSWGVSWSDHADPDRYSPDLHSAYRAGPSSGQSQLNCTRLTCSPGHLALVCL